MKSFITSSQTDVRATEPRTDMTAAKNSGSSDAGQSSDPQDSSYVHMCQCQRGALSPRPHNPKRQGQGRGGSPDIDQSGHGHPF